MQIGGISSYIGSLQTQSGNTLQRTNQRLAALIGAISSGDRITRAAEDVASMATAAQLQGAVNTDKVVLSNLAQASSLLQVADNGAEQIGNLIGELQKLAVQSNSGALNEDNRKALNQQFKQITKEIDRIAGNTSFGGTKLLDGSFTLESNGNELAQTELSDLSASALLGNLDISTQEGAEAALAALGSAQNSVLSERSKIGASQQGIDFASANVSSAILNQEAARAVLSDTDLGAASTEFSLLDLQRNVQIAMQAQGNRLSPTILQLLA